MIYHKTFLNHTSATIYLHLLTVWAIDFEVSWRTTLLHLAQAVLHLLAVFQGQMQQLFLPDDGTVSVCTYDAEAPVNYVHQYRAELRVLQTFMACMWVSSKDSAIYWLMNLFLSRL